MRWPLLTALLALFALIPVPSASATTQPQAAASVGVKQYFLVDAAGRRQAVLTMFADGTEIFEFVNGQDGAYCRLSDRDGAYHLDMLAPDGRAGVFHTLSTEGVLHVNALLPNGSSKKIWDGSVSLGSGASRSDLEKYGYRPLAGPSGVVLAEFDLGADPPGGDIDLLGEYGTWALLNISTSGVEARLGSDGLAADANYQPLENYSWLTTGAIWELFGGRIHTTTFPWLQLPHLPLVTPVLLQDDTGAVLASYGKPDSSLANGVKMMEQAYDSAPTTPTLEIPCSAGQTTVNVYTVEEFDKLQEGNSTDPYDTGRPIGAVPCGIEAVVLKSVNGNLKIRLPNGLLASLLTSTGQAELSQITAAEKANAAAEAQRAAERVAKRPANLHQYALPERALATACGSGNFVLWSDFLGEGDIVADQPCKQPVYLVRDTVTGRELMTQRGDIGFQVFPALQPVTKPSDILGIRSLGYRTGEVDHVHRGLLIPAQSSTSCSWIVDDLDCSTDSTPPERIGAGVTRTYYVTSLMATGGGYMLNFVCNGDRRLGHCPTLKYGTVFNAYIVGNQLYVTSVCANRDCTKTKILTYTITHTDPIDMSKVSYPDPD